MDKLIVRARLASPLIRGGHLTLDGLLACRLFEELQDVEKALAAIPVRQSDGLYHASSVMLEAPMRESAAFIASLRPQHSMDPDLLLKNSKGAVHRKFDSSVTNVMNSYSTEVAPFATWYVEGDADAIVRLLSSIRFIGKRRASGFGEIALRADGTPDWEFELDGDSSDRFGLENLFGDPLRPIPADRFQGDKGYHPLVDAAWRPAYWDPRNRAACYAPQLAGEDLSC